MVGWADEDTDRTTTYALVNFDHPRPLGQPYDLD